MHTATAMGDDVAFLDDEIAFYDALATNEWALLRSAFRISRSIFSGLKPSETSVFSVINPVDQPAEHPRNLFQL